VFGAGIPTDRHSYLRSALQEFLPGYHHSGQRMKPSSFTNRERIVGTYTEPAQMIFEQDRDASAG